MLTTADLTMRYYNPKVLRPLCEACDNYGRNYACPPLDIDIEKRLSEYRNIHIFAEQYTAKSFLGDSGACSNSAREAFEKARKTFDTQLKEWEIKLDGVMLAPGRCTLCESCARAENAPCRRPNDMRISLDAYCIEIVKLVRELCGIEIEWSGTGLQKHITMIGAVLSNTSLIENNILQS